MSSSPKVLIYGGKGALGSACVDLFKANNWWVGNVDMHANQEADANIVLTRNATWCDQERDVVERVASALAGSRLDAIVCVAGGWAGGNAASKDFISNCELVWKQSVWTSTIATSLAAKHLSPTGLLVLTGAVPALEGTPGMIGYGMAKACVHQLVASLADEKSGMSSQSTSVAILPVTLDTPMNRKFMPKADFTSWTPLPRLAEELLKWTAVDQRPKSGSLMKVITENSKTEFVLHE